MAGKYSETEIQALCLERKPLPDNWRTRMILRSKRGHSERDLEVDGDSGNTFRVILRQNRINVFDFSIIVAVCVPNSNQLFRLRRYNGKSHEHTNHIEGDTFYAFHIHIATERYQELGTREDAYAEPTERYGDFHEAFRCLLSDMSFDVPPEIQRRLFEEVT